MPIPVLNIADMRRWEELTWATGQTPAAVIQRVGELVAQRALGLTRHDDTILVLAGKGHNGDDTVAAAPHLHARRTELVRGMEQCA